MATNVTVHGMTVQVAVRLTEGRSAAITVRPLNDGVHFAVWGRPRGEPNYHPWPSLAHELFEFFSHFEEAVLRGGLEELMHCLVGKTFDEPLLAKILETVQYLLEVLAGGPIEDSPAP